MLLTADEVRKQQNDKHKLLAEDAVILLLLWLSQAISNDEVVTNYIVVTDIDWIVEDMYIWKQENYLGNMVWKEAQLKLNDLGYQIRFDSGSKATIISW